ncbi:MAG TPA: flagellar hook-basal body protein [Bacilli bacterium]
MLRGLYTAAAGMIAQERRHDAITNNIANINTPGYKEGNAALRSFPEMLIYLVNGEQNAPPQHIGRLATGVFAEEAVTLFSQGDIQTTNNASDFALVSDIPVFDAQGNRIPFDQTGKYVDPNGQVFFQPQAFFTLASPTDPDERLYTRDGSFHVNEQNELVTANGYRVLGADGQPIVLDRPLDAINVAADGTLMDADGFPLTQLFISRIENPNRLIPETGGVYRLDADAAQPAQVNPDDQVIVRQGAIERSNVDPIQSMVDLMTALRAYEANQKVIQFYDRSLDKAVNEVGRV